MSKKNRAFKRREIKRLREIEEEYRKVRFYAHDWFKDRQLLAEYRDFISNPKITYSMRDGYFNIKEYRFNLKTPENTMHVNCVRTIDKDLIHRLQDSMFDDAKRYFAEFLVDRLEFVYESEDGKCTD